MYDFKETESRVGKFWAEQGIFEKSLELRRKGKRFVFWEGPPTANGKPHTGHFLTRIYKDVYGRYKTMRGFFVLRKAGWDTHGLPVEIEIEKELGFNNKKQIEEYGIAKFNRKARESVWKYTKEWEDMTRRMGFWLDMTHPYVTYHPNYMESVWSILKEIWNKGLLYKAHKVVPFCVRCGTPLSAHEVAQEYRKVTENSVYLKFKLKNESDTYILAWTTTPWTLPGNVALAVGSDIVYVYAKKGNERYVIARDLVGKVLGEGYQIEKEVSGNDLVGLEYEPLFDVPELKSERSYKIYLADFVTTTDGTGVVHTAVMYGEDDYILGTKLDLPKIHTVTEQGKFIDSLGDGLAGKAIIETHPGPEQAGKKNQATEDLIIQKLMANGSLLMAMPYEHDYPFCWRCHTPLLYYAKSSWFIKTSALNKELLANNETVNWIPEHVKHGRFGQWLREARDWTLSRERYWGTPLPIWECDQCDNKEALGSIKEIEKLAVGSKNTYYVMRHGGTDRNEKFAKIISSDLAADKYHLTPEGQADVENSLELLKLDGIDMIYASPFIRTRETAEIAARFLHQKLEIDDRLREEGHDPALEGKVEKTRVITSLSESIESIRARLNEFMHDLESRHRNKKILIVTHGSPAWHLEAIGRGLGLSDISSDPNLHPYLILATAEFRLLKWRRIPRNEYGELDLHRPFIDEVVIKCPKCKSKMRKIPDLIDVWFDSGAMPYAQWHYPFENKKTFKEQFPADFIVEGMDQTRGWFWSLLGISTLLGRGAPYKNVMALGFTLDEKGVKESKSKGNYVPIIEFIDRHGSDILRWYFASSMSAGENKAVIGREIEDKLKGFFFTLQNCIRFYELYGNGVTNYELRITNSLDKWLLSRFSRMLRDATNNLDSYDTTTAARAIEQFVAEDLSNWWLRRSRRRKDALPLLRSVLLNLARMLAPFTPFMAEDLWHRLTVNNKFLGKGSRAKPGISVEAIDFPQSVHLTNWPKAQKKYINDKLEAEMAAARAVITLGLAERKDKQLKVRQPLAAATLKGAKFSVDLEALIKDELNVKKIGYDKDQESEVALDLKLSPELTREGYVRELMRQIQDMRKEAKYNMEDMVAVLWESSDEEIIESVGEWAEEIKKDTNLSKLEKARPTEGQQSFGRESDLAPGKKIWLGIKK